MKPLAKTSLALPIQEMMQNKFAKETGQSGHAATHDSDKMAAVKMGMFGERTRTTFQWYPHNSLAKRFNIPNPYPGAEIVGVPHLQKSSKKETLLNLGLPQTANDLAQRKAREENLREEELEKEAKEPKDIDMDRPPKSIFDAIFGESESESDSDEEEEEEQKKEEEPKEQKEMDKEKTEEQKDATNEQPKPKPITVMDIVEEEEEFGPAPPTSVGETISGFSVLTYLKDELAKRRESKKSHSQKKHKTKKSKKEKSSKKSKKEKKSKKSRRKHRSSSSSSSSDSSVVEIID